MAKNVFLSFDVFDKEIIEMNIVTIISNTYILVLPQEQTDIIRLKNRISSIAGY